MRAKEAWNRGDRSRRRPWAAMAGMLVISLTAGGLAQACERSHGAAAVPSGTSAFDAGPGRDAVDLAPFRRSSATLALPHFAGTGEGMVFAGTVPYSTHDAGGTWLPGQDLGRLPTQVRVDADGEVLASHDIYGSPLSHSVDGGGHSEYNEPPAIWEQDVSEPYLASGHEAWKLTWADAAPLKVAARQRVAVVHTRDGGRAWTAQATFATSQLAGDGFSMDISGLLGHLAFRDSLHGIFTRALRTQQPLVPATVIHFFRTDDGGAHWVPVAVPAPQETHWLDGYANLLPAVVPGGFAVVARGPVTAPPDCRAFTYLSTDDGATWSEPRELPSGGTSTCRGVVGGQRLSAPDADHWFWASGSDVYGSRDQGRGWMRLGGVDSHLEIHDPGFSSSDRGWLLATVRWGPPPGATTLPGEWTGDALFTTADGGRTWIPVPPPAPAPIRAQCMAPSSLTIHYRAFLHYLDSRGRPYGGPDPGVGRADHCIYWLNTDRAGTIHIDLPSGRRGMQFTLADYFALGGSSPDPYAEPLLGVSLDGQGFTRNVLSISSIPLHPNTRIVIQVNAGS